MGPALVLGKRREHASLDGTIWLWWAAHACPLPLRPGWNDSWFRFGRLAAQHAGRFGPARVVQAVGFMQPVSAVPTAAASMDEVT